jgi:histidinol-phosphate aminotransferase
VTLNRGHGGPDARAAARWDFSTNANACGPCPLVLEALRQADATRYPDPQYGALREKLADWHGVEARRIVVAASASEFIVRITGVVARITAGVVRVPLHAYGDYAVAAHAHGLKVVHEATHAALAWHCDPSSPLGQAAPPNSQRTHTISVLDLAYAPLRLEGESHWQDAALDAVFQLHSPNKALGLTGIRGAYAIAPPDAAPWVSALEAAAPSWPLGAHAVAMLDAWPNQGTQRWLARSRDTLRAWKRTQVEMFTAMGCPPAPSVANFFCARWPDELPLTALREEGIALRDCSSFGLPGWVRASVQPPAAQQVLHRTLVRWHDKRRDAEAPQ